jgi:hypothetical protein
MCGRIDLFQNCRVLPTEEGLRALRLPSNSFHFAVPLVVPNSENTDRRMFGLGSGDPAKLCALAGVGAAFATPTPEGVFVKYL